MLTYAELVIGGSRLRGGTADGEPAGARGTGRAFGNLARPLFRRSSGRTLEYYVRLRTML
jgi:hypothetical protein